MAIVTVRYLPGGDDSYACSYCHCTRFHQIHFTIQICRISDMACHGCHGQHHCAVETVSGGVLSARSVVALVITLQQLLRRPSLSVAIGYRRLKLRPFILWGRCRCYLELCRSGYRRGSLLS